MNKEHENWVRYHAVLLAYQANRFSNADKIVNDAAKIAKFILAKPDCEILPISKQGGEE